jgi:hypothetical protein
MMFERRWIVVAMAATLAVGACEKKSPSPDKQVPAELRPTKAAFDPKLVAPALFAYIPADTPYVIASFEATPLEYYAKLKHALGPAFSNLIKKKQAQGGEPDLFDAIVDEFGGSVNAKALEDRGLSAKPRFAIYGLGVAPVVVRLEIKDEAALRATIDRVAAKMGKQLPAQETKDGKAFWRFVDDNVTGIVAILDNQLVGAAGPSALVDAKLDLILGLQKPAQSMADGKALIDVATRHGFGPYLVGYVDTHELAAQGLTLSDTPPPPACGPALDVLATQVPRIVVGYTEFTAKRASGGLVVELAPALLAEVTALRAQVPGLGAALSDQPLLAFGGGVDIAKGAALLARAATAVHAIGEACQVPELSEKAAAAEDTLSSPLPPPVTKITGFAAALQAFEMSGVGFTQLDGFGMVTATSGKALFDDLKGLLPLDQIGLTADGKLHELAIPSGVVPGAVVAGVGDKAIVFATGAKGRALAERGLHGTASGPSPFLVMTYDYGRLLQLQSQMAAMRGGAPEDAELIKSMAAVLGRASMTVDANDKGVVVWSALDLK